MLWGVPVEIVMAISLQITMGISLEITMGISLEITMGGSLDRLNGSRLMPPTPYIGKISENLNFATREWSRWLRLSLQIIFPASLRPELGRRTESGSDPSGFVSCI